MDKSKVAKILILCGDPGGAQAVLPIIKFLHGLQTLEVQVYAYYKSVNLFKENKINMVEIDNEILDAEIRDLQIRFSPDLVLVGTSSNQFDLEKIFIQIAKDLNIPTLAILDFWSNYAIRFSQNDADFKYLPDKIAIMDNLAHSEMISEGFPPEKLVITGQPAFDRLRKLKSEFSSDMIDSIKSNLGIKLNQHFVLFISQPFSQLFGSDDSNPLYPGFDEKSSFDNLLNVLNKFVRNNLINIVVGVKPHLREDQKWWKKVDGNQVQFIDVEDYDFEELSMAASVVTGLTSTRLFESSELGAHTLSLQIGAPPSKRFNMEKFGIDKNIYSIDCLKLAMESFLNESREISNSKKDAQNNFATNNVLKLIFEMLGLENSEIKTSLADLRMEV